MAAQSIRRSQFITTYGPGAILEGPEGPRIIPDLGRSGLFDQRRPTDFEITDSRLSQALLANRRILRLPSNAELGVADSVPIYDTRLFPTWALCLRHGRQGVLYHKTQSDTHACPRCAPLPSAQQAWRQVGRQAIRFVRACPDGHLDDVDWVYVAHGHSNCTPGYLMWQGGGAALRHIDIACPVCGISINLGIAYSRPWPCSGRFPEFGAARPGCNQDSKIMQRGAANLRVPELQTALTIPPRSTRLHRLLEMFIIQGVVFSSPSITSRQDLLTALQPLVQQGLLAAAVVTEIGHHPDQAVAEAIYEIRTGNQLVTPGMFRTQELAALRYAAANGAPPQPSSTPGSPPQFEVVQQEVRTIPLQSGRRLRVTPVNRLRVVMVQTGYRRVPAGNLLASAAVDCVYDDGQRQWYPGVELFGEGIFIDFDPDPAVTGPAWHFPFQGREWMTWMAAWTDPDGFGQNIRPDEQDQLHPVFVWWHTLAHRLINALSVDSGYSSAAVRERVFIDIDRQTGQATGGVLLYTAQPGGDGTLGGLVALVPEFERVLDNAFRNVDSCSNGNRSGGVVRKQTK